MRGLIVVLFVSASGIVGAQAPQSAAPAVLPVAAAPPAQGSKVWLGHEGEYEAFLKSAKIERLEKVPVGVTAPRRGYFETGGLARSAVFKALPPGRSSGYYESYKSEIAAYELDKLLGLGMVPPTVEKIAKSDVGSAQLWVDNCVLLKTRDTSKAPDVGRWNRQVYRQRVFDNLIGNIDRNQGNLLIDPEWNLILIDHSRAFTNTQTMPFPMTRIDREFLQRLRGLTKEDLDARLGKLVPDGTRPILARRDRIVKQFDKMIAERGEAAVLIP
jgi:hypothetical protein